MPVHYSGDGIIAAKNANLHKDKNGTGRDLERDHLSVLNNLCCHHALESPY